jgi:hypothetical protein
MMAAGQQRNQRERGEPCHHAHGQCAPGPGHRRAVSGSGRARGCLPRQTQQAQPRGGDVSAGLRTPCRTG